MKDEDETTVKDHYKYFKDQNGKIVNFTLSDVQDGVYMYKKLRVNRETGSIMDNWMRLACWGTLQTEDARYLQRISTPQISLETIEVRKGKLVLENFLQQKRLCSLSSIRFANLSNLEVDV